MMAHKPSTWCSSLGDLHYSQVGCMKVNIKELTFEKCFEGLNDNHYYYIVRPIKRSRGHQNWLENWSILWLRERMKNLLQLVLNACWNSYKSRNALLGTKLFFLSSVRQIVDLYYFDFVLGGIFKFEVERKKNKDNLLSWLAFDICRLDKDLMEEYG